MEGQNAGTDGFRGERRGSLLENKAGVNPARVFAALQM